MKRTPRTDEATKQKRLQDVISWIDDGHNAEEMLRRSAVWGTGNRQFYNYLSEARDVIRKQTAEWTQKRYGEVRQSILAKLDELYYDERATLRDQITILQEINKVAQGGDTPLIENSSSGLSDVSAEDIKKRLKSIKGGKR